MAHAHFVIIRLGVLGDVVLTTGVLQYLHIHYHYTFSVITREAFAPIFENHPAVTHIHVLPNKPSFFTLVRFTKRLAQQYATTPLIDLHGNLRTMVISYMWRASTFVYTKYTKERKQFLRSRSQELSTLLCATSVTQRYFLAFQKYTSEAIPSQDALAARVFITQKEREACIQKFSPPKHAIAIHPYASHNTKIWPLEYWKELIHILHERNYSIIILGKSDAVFSSPHIPIEYNFTNRTSIRESLVLLEHATALITPDSGLLHLATATRTPSIALFGATTQEWGFFPPAPSIIVEDKSLMCRPCSLHGNTPCTHAMECMYNLEPMYVFNKMQELIASSHT